MYRVINEEIKGDSFSKNVFFENESTKYLKNIR